MGTGEGAETYSHTPFLRRVSRVSVMIMHLSGDMVFLRIDLLKVPEYSQPPPHLLRAVINPHVIW